MVSLLSVGLVLLGSIVGSYGTYVIKKASDAHTLLQIWRSRYLWFGGIGYALSVIFYVLALRQEELSVVYPLVSMSYIWTTLLSVKGLGEKMNGWKWAGLAGIILGVVLVGLGSS